MAQFEDAVRFGGMVLAHVAWIASDLEDGALVCPFAIIQTGSEREVVAFESDSQAESIERGKASFQDYKERVDFWSFAREGLLSYVGSDEPKVDVLTVSAWRQGLDEPVILRQRYNPKMKGGFKLVGPIEVVIHGMIPPEPTSSALRLIALQGVEQHPHSELWATWIISAPDPPLSLATAEERFKLFLAQNGYPTNVVWILSRDILVDRSGRYWIRRRETQTDGTSEANRRYSVGLEKKIGISLRAICASETETFAAVFVPSDAMDAQHHLMGRSLKLSCPSDLVPAHLVRNAIRWLPLSLRNRSRAQMLDEL